MLSLRAKFDGRSLQFEKDITIDRPQDVIVLFLNIEQSNKNQQDINGKELANMLSTNPALNFAYAEEEEIYSDADLKKKY